MANNLANKFINAEDLSSILSHLVTKVNDKINTKPKIEIADTGEFVINDKNTGVKAKGENGNTTIKLDIDSSNNVIATMNDNTTINIGNLNPTVSPDMVSENGFGNLRYYNGKFQYKNNNTWIDIVSTSDNKIYQSLMPKPLEHFIVQYDESLNKNILTLTPPSDTIIDNQTICFVEKVIIRRKKDSIPTDINDGEDVLVLTREHLRDYQNEGYIDTSFNGNDDEIWYYRAFPVSTLGLVNMENNYARIVVGSRIYGFHIDQNESDPDSMITYIEDNVGFKPAHMDYGTNTFDYGDWENVWFIKKLKPCMLRYDGTVDYELDKNDYSKKADGSDSDVSNINYEGNAMVGIPKVYYKVVDNGDDTVNVYISDKKVDEDYHCWSHLDNEGNEINYCYMPIYRGYVKDGKMRSLSGVIASSSYTAEQEITFAKANNLSSDEIWYTFVWCDKVIIDLLLMLIGKSTDTQTVFGKGKSNYSSSGTDESKTCGTGDTKGLFWGGNTGKEVVKVFGMEDYWGSSYYRMAGMAQVNSNFVVKMTYSMNDGTSINGYNIDGKGYINILKNTLSSDPDYVTKMKYTPYGIFPIECKSGSASTYYCDAGYFYVGSTTCYPFFGGEATDGARCGIFSYAPYYSKTRAVSWLGTAISCKPLASTQNS